MTDPKQKTLFDAPWTLDAPGHDVAESAAKTYPEVESPVPPALADIPKGEVHADLPESSVEKESSVPPSPLRIVEAMLFIGGAPLTEARACEAIRGLTPELFRDLVAELNVEYRRQGRPLHVRQQDQGHVLKLRPTFRIVEDRLNGGTREARLSQTAIDTLALVAYRQPATKDEIDAIRGSDSASLLRLLLRRGLIALERGRADQQQVSYCTTRRFLELFHLKSLDDLPQTQDLQKI